MALVLNLKMTNSVRMLLPNGEEIELRLSARPRSGQAKISIKAPDNVKIDRPKERGEPT